MKKPGTPEIEDSRPNGSEGVRDDGDGGRPLARASAGVSGVVAPVFPARPLPAPDLEAGVLPWECWACTSGGVATRGAVFLLGVGVGGVSTVEVTVGVAGSGAAAGVVAAGGGAPVVACSLASALDGTISASIAAVAASTRA
jgi:hypothetical protein